MPGLKDILQETHRRAIWQVSGTYVAGAWVVLQVVEVLMETIGLPDWVPKFALVLLLLGLPIVVATSVIQGAVRKRIHAAAPIGERSAATAGEDAAAAKLAAGEAGIGPATEDAAESVEPGSESPTRPVSEAAATSGGARGLFTWRNALLGGIAAFALLGLVTTGWMAMRALGIGPIGSLVARGVIEEGERVILADFAGDSAVADAATLAFRVDLAQSKVVSPADPAYVSQVLKRMQRPPDSRIDAALAREIAIREGVKAVIAGDIAPVGTSFVISTRLVASESGEELAAFRETAKDAKSLLGSIDKLSKNLRARLGESLRAIHANEPLEDVTTPSLAALQKYSQAWNAINAGRRDQGVALLEEAIELDSTFAMAWRKLATVTLGDRSVEAARRAYENRARLTDRERYHTTGLYHISVTQDLQQAETAYLTLLEAYPDDAVALNNLGVVYAQQDDLERAATMYSRALAIDSLSAHYPRNLVPLLYRLGRPDSALAVLERFERNVPDHPAVADLGFQFAVSERDYEEAARRLEPRLASEVPGQREDAREDEARLALLHGRLARAEELLRESGASEPARELETELHIAHEIDLFVRLDTARAVRRARDALARYDLASMTPNARNNIYDDLLVLLAQAAESDARTHAADWAALAAQESPELGALVAELLEKLISAYATVKAGDPSAALSDLREITARMPGDDCDDRCVAQFVGPVYEAAGMPDSVVAIYRRFIDQPDWDPLRNDAWMLPRAYLAIARAHDVKGDLERASEYYARFLGLWENADAELQPRVEAVRRRLEEIVAKRG